MLASIADAQRVTVAGVVRDSATDRPIGGAIVEIASADRRYAIRSDEDGRFQIFDVTLGPYRAVVRRIGYSQVAREIVVTSGMKELHVELAPIPQALREVQVRGEGTGIYGLVGSASDLKPIPGAQVYVAGARDSALTDSAGAYYLDVKRPGNFVVRVRAPGFADQLFIVDVKRNQVADGSALLDVGESRRVPPILWKDLDQRLSWRTANQTALVTGSELRRAGTSVTSSLSASGTMVAKGLRIGPGACIFVNGQARPGFPLDAIRPEEITAIEVYSPRTDAAKLLIADWPKNMKCSATGLTNAGAPNVLYVVIWTK